MKQLQLRLHSINKNYSKGKTMEFENKKLRSVAEAAARIMMGEKALHPNQQKLDVHEPEKDKLTSHDFKKLRTMKKEETMHEESCDCGDCPSDKDMKKEEVELEEMDKEGYTATRDGDDYTKGKQITVKPKSVMSSKSATSSAFRQLNKAFNKDSEKKDMKKEEVDLDEARSVNLKAGKVGNEVHMSKWMQDHTKKNKSTGSSDAWNEYHGKGTVTHLGKDGHVKVKSHDTGMTHKFDYYGKGVGRDSEDMSVHGSKDDIHSLRNVKEEVDLDEGKMGQLDADLKDLSHADFQKEYGKPKHHYDPSNFKKPVQPGKEMDRAKSLAQRAMASMKKEEVEELEEMFPGTPEYEKKYGKAPQDMKKGEKKKTTQGEMEKTGKGVVHRRKFSEMVESYTEGGVKGLFKTLAEEPTSAEFDAQLDDAKQRAAGTKKQPEVSKPAVQAVKNEEVELTLEDFTPEELEEFMQTEDYEQLDELSKATLGSYVKKASVDSTISRKLATDFEHRGDRAKKPSMKASNYELEKEYKRKSWKRRDNINKAVDRLTKEGVEQVEEQTHTTVEFIDYNDVNGVKYAEIDLAERKLTDAETGKKEEIVKSMKKGLSGFKERYGKDAKSVMYATATARAKGD
jgi:hypothetical protein